MKYEDTLACSTELYGEWNDCAVHALCVLTDTPYPEMHKLLETKGRKHGGGTKVKWVYETLTELGFTHREVLFKAKTVRTLPAELPTGSYLVYTSGHFLALKDGVVEDWTAGRLHRVKGVYAIARGIELLPARGKHEQAAHQ